MEERVASRTSDGNYTIRQTMSPFGASWRLIGSTVGCLLCGSPGVTPLAAQKPAKESAQSTQPAATPAAIEDNSFLIEEAYNQETGVVQHINTFARQRGTRAWAYNFTQEWPLFSQRHQLSYTVPIVSAGPGTGSGIGDVALNYRYQLADGTRSGVAVAPRFSLLVATGDERQGRGTGGNGLQVNLPVSLELSPLIVTHWNAGATYTPSAKNALGDKASTRSYNAGGSVIWLARSTFNVMLEAVWARAEEVTGPSQRLPYRIFYVSPGVRGAINFPSGLQIVPGIAVPIGVGPSSGDGQVFFYLSFEHPFSQ
jgi:hypothetical protein